MKTLNNIKRMVLVAIVVVLMSTNLEAQKAYHNVSFERGIVELNNLANRLIEKYKIKFDLNNAVTIIEMQSASEISAENELNGLIDNLAENAKFDVIHTISVTEAKPESSELDQLTNELTESMKFDANQTILVTEANEENSELNQLTDELMGSIKFNVNQIISVTEANDENNELDQLTNELISNMKFDVNKTISVEEDQMAVAF